MREFIVMLFLLAASLSGCLESGDNGFSSGDESDFIGHYHGYDFSFGLDFDNDTGEFIVYPRLMICPEDLEAEYQSMVANVDPETDIHPMGSVIVENECIYLSYRPSMYGFVWNYSSSDYEISKVDQTLEITFSDSDGFAEKLVVGTNGAFFFPFFPGFDEHSICSLAGGSVPGVTLSGEELLNMDDKERDDAIEAHLSVFTNSSIMNNPQANSCATSKLGMQDWLEYANEHNADGDLTLYAFDAEDSQGTPSNGTNDRLVMVTMTQGGDIHWDSIDVVISVNGSAPLLCDGHGESDDDCQLIEFGNTDDEVWSVGDGVTLYENDFDLCPDVCSLDIRIEHTSEGRVIYELTGVLAE